MDKKSNIAKSDKSTKSASYERIKATFISLLDKKRVNQISVSEICKQCQINRSTFYANFQDIYEVLEAIEVDLAYEVYALYDDHEPAKDIFSEEYLKIFLEYLKENQVFYRAYFEGSYYTYQMDLDRQPMWLHFFQPALRYLGVEITEEQKYHFEFFKGGFLAVIHKWIHEGCKETPESMARILRRSTPKM